MSKKQNKQLQTENKETPKPEVKEEIPAEDLNAAIATALYLYKQEVHDYENLVLTIKRVEKKYSPWSSKIYSLRKWPGGDRF